MELNQNQTLGDGSKTLGQIMTPVQDPDYDSNSLKRSEFFFQFSKKEVRNYYYRRQARRIENLI